MRYQATDNLRLIPLAAPDMENLQAQLQEMAKAESLPQVAYAAWKTYQANPSAPLRVMLIASDMAELRREAASALTGIPTAVQNNKKWLTAKGSCFTPSPLRGPVTFVYPGAFNSYSNLSPDLFHLFPSLYSRFAQVTSGPILAMRADALYPRSGTHLSEAERKAFDQALLADPMAMVASGTSFATLYTLIMREWFNVQPAAALGYSLGEAAMMWALGIWTHGDEAAHALRESDLFKTRVAGPKLAVREAWSIDPSIPDDEVWRTYVLMAPVEQVSECLEDEPHAYIAIINTSNEVVLVGDPAACTRIITRLNCHALRAPFDHVIHCPPMRSEYAGFDALHHWPVQQTPDIICYSAANYEPTDLTTESIAHNVSTVSTSQVDFPRLVRRAYNDGARIFVELGPHRTCSRWIDTILGDEPHLALSINQKGRSDQNSLIRLLAQLAAHHVPLDLSPLFEDVSAPVMVKAKAGFVKRIPLGGDRIADTLLTDANRAYFADLPRRAAQPAVPAPCIAEEMKVLRRNWQALMIDTPAPSSSNTQDHGKTLMTSAPKSIMTPAKIFLRPNNQTLSPELLVLLEDYQRKNKSAPAAQMTHIPKVIKALKPSNVIWDEADLLQYAQGNIAEIFGNEYALIDTYSRRVRLPMPPYLLVSRITKLDAKMGEFKPSHMTTEYDIPLNAWYSVDGQIPWAIAVESGQCDLMLISYLGIDFENKGNLVYRLLDCTLTFLDDLPKEGETLRYDISINSYARSGDNLLFFFSYNCFVGDRMVLKMRGGCAGFFSDEDLARGKGIILTEAEIAARNNTPKQHFDPLLTCERKTFGRPELQAFSAGDLLTCFGPQYMQTGRNQSLRLPGGNMLMIDRITEIQPDGGPWELGSVVAEHDLAPDNWYFPCHFKDDEVMAGSLMADGCVQLMQFYLMYLGFQTETIDARFQPIPDLPQVVRCRGQVTPTHARLIYRMEITEIGLIPRPYAKANVDIILNGKVIVNFKDLGLQLVEKNPPVPVTANKAALFDERHITEFALGSLAACFGPEYATYDTRRAPRTPNGDLQLISRVLSVDGIRGQVVAGSSLVTEYDVPAHPWYCEQNAYPTVPYSILMEIGLQPCGFLSAHLGSTLPYPDENFYFRNLDGNGKYLREI